MITFEVLFRDFIRTFGGEVLEETDGKRADFLFREDNVVAELKTLQKDAREQHAQKLGTLVESWRRRRLVIVYGQTQISLRTLPPICQNEWLQILQPPIENIIRKANRQIRSTKESFDLPSAKGILLIANDGNFLHTDPLDYMNLTARTLQKKEAGGAPRFPHIEGVVYFSYRIVSRNEGHPFWVAGQMERASENPVRRFQDKLQAGWFSYIAQKYRLRIKIEAPMEQP